MAKKPRNSSVYVISLNLDVMKDKRFREANPSYIEGKPCVYVGMTGRTPDERFQQHMNGYKSSRYPKRYGNYLRRKLFEHFGENLVDKGVGKGKSDIGADTLSLGQFCGHPALHALALDQNNLFI